MSVDGTHLSKNRQTAKALVTAFNLASEDGISTIMSLRTSECQRQFLPLSMGLPPQSNLTVEKSLRQLLPVFSNFSLVVHDTIEDLAQSKIVMWLSARGDTNAGEYANEYIWILEFDDDGLIHKSTEFVDSVMQRDFWPKLKEAMTKEQQVKREL